MAKVIRVTPNENKRLIISLYGEEIDVTNIVNEEGKGEFEAFGETYQFEVESKTRKKIREIVKYTEVVGEGENEA